jgi:hypothetical protein
VRTVKLQDWLCLDFLCPQQSQKLWISFCHLFIINLPSPCKFEFFCILFFIHPPHFFFLSSNYFKIHEATYGSFDDADILFSVFSIYSID